MKKEFGLVKRGDLFLLRKLTYPHFKAYVDLSKIVPEIKKITFLEKCHSYEMADAIREGSKFLETVNTEEYKKKEYILRKSLLEKSLSPAILLYSLATRQLSGKTKLAFHVMIQLLIILNRK